MEIERKYLIDTLPEDYQDYPCRHIESGRTIINMNSLINQKVSWQEKNIICHLMKLHISICSQRLTDVSSEKNVI